MPSSSSTKQLNRGAITVCVMLATVMQALDTTIANVALPYIQGTVAASQDQITWVLTSYIVAAAIMTPPTGYLAGRFGLKNVFLVSVTGFTVASMLCGMADSLVSIVGFRVVQGLFGAALVPLSQTVLMNINPPEKQGSAMAIWGVAVMAGPVLGPVLGGWLTFNYSWRYVFYINLPVGLIALAGMWYFLYDTPKDSKSRLDWFGFAMLSIAIGGMQIALDRGEQKDWLGSGEIIGESLVAVVAFYLFLVHIFTAREPFVRPQVFRNRNFSAGVLFVFVVGLTYYASMALQPPYLQDLMNYPIVTAGLVMGPRGVGTMAAMLVVGRLIGKVDTRVLLGLGLALTAWSFYEMTGWTPDVSQMRVVVIGVVQGAGLGFLFVPLSTTTLATLAPEARAEGAGLYNLSRNIGSSVGISVVNSLLTTDAQVNHEDIAAAVTPFNRAMTMPAMQHFWDPFTAAGQSALNVVVDRQAEIIAYIDDYKFLMIATLCVLPLLLVFKKASGGHDHSMAVE
jgi:MFS transporter, DHA2 family, multidrug resistance protein